MRRIVLFTLVLVLVAAVALPAQRNARAQTYDPNVKQERIELRFRRSATPARRATRLLTSRLPMVVSRRC